MCRVLCGCRDESKGRREQAIATITQRARAGHVTRTSSKKLMQYDICYFVTRRTRPRGLLLRGALGSTGVYSAGIVLCDWRPAGPEQAADEIQNQDNNLMECVSA